jgi:hypothetical protein
MKYIVYISLIALLLTPTYQQVVPDASLDLFLSQYVGAWLSANLGAYLDAALAPLLNKLASLESLATAPVAPAPAPVAPAPAPVAPAPVAPAFPPAPVAPVFPSAPTGGSVLCYSCNENWLACKSPIDIGRVEGNLVRCNGQCVKFQNPNDGMSINIFHIS